MDVEQVRENLRKAVKERGVNMAALSRGMGRAPSYISDFLRGKKATLAGLESFMLEDALGLPTGSLMVGRDVSPTAPTPRSGKSFTQELVEMGQHIDEIPVFSATEAGTGEMMVSADPIEYIPRPSYLKKVREGFAVVVVGESMIPRYEPGEIVVVNPKGVLIKGKDVIVTTDREGGDFRAVIKSLQGQHADRWNLRQYNPPKDFSLPKREWPHALRVVGRYDQG